MKLRVLGALILCNAIWAFIPVMGKILLQDFTPLQAGWLRYASAFVAVLGFVIGIHLFAPHSKKLQLRPPPKNLSLWLWLTSLGIVTFFGSPLFQFAGLTLSSATANSLMVAIEPMFCALLAWILLKEKISARQGIAGLVSVFGFVLLSRFSFGAFSRFQGSTLQGNLLLMMMMPCEAWYTILSRILRDRLNAVEIFSYSLCIGFLILTFFVAHQEAGLPNLSHLSARSLLAIVWVGPLGTAFGYIYWTVALAGAPVAPVVLTLLVQPLLGSLNGYFFLNERLSLLQFLGGALILVALLIDTDFSKKEGTKNES